MRIRLHEVRNRSKELFKKNKKMFIHNLALQMHLKLLEDTDTTRKKRVYLRLKNNPEIEKFNQLRQLLVNLDKVKPPDNEAFLAQKRQKEQAEHLQNLIREEQEMEKIENLSEESLED